MTVDAVVIAVTATVSFTVVIWIAWSNFERQQQWTYCKRRFATR